MKLSATAQKAYEAIRQQIEQGVLGPNDRIIEIDLSDALQMSRTPVREALRKLVDERWLEYLPNRGMRVRVWESKDVQDNFQVRLLLETEAAALAARYILPADIEMLAMVNGQLRSMAGFRMREDAIEKMTELNLDFHQGVWRASGNRILAEILQRNINIPTMFSTYRHYDERKFYDSLDEHDQMLQSFKERNEALARELMRSHLQRASNIFVEEK
ncbi:MAG: GntR family transcriptional regulator [Cyclobacteriaceae bacterium]